MVPWAEVEAVTVATAAGLLAWAGAVKMLSGEPPAGLPRRAARPFAVLELTLGLACLATAGVAAEAGLAVLYAVFSVVVARSLVQGGGGGCGCLGGDEQADLPHLAIDLVATAAAAVALLRPPRPLLVLVQHSPPLAAATLAVLVGCAVACAALVLAHLSRSLRAYRPAREQA